MNSTPADNSAPVEYALWYANGLGFSVFPCYAARADGTCTCRKPLHCKDQGKHPMTRHGFRDATRDPDAIREHWRKHPGANVGIATGEPSGLLVVDIDPRHDGEQSYKELRKRLGDPPKVPHVATGGGGWHLLFARPSIAIKSQNSVAPGIDIKCEGGYIIAPPSLHKSGKRYLWKVTPDTLPPPTLPESWLDWLRTTKCYTEYTESRTAKTSDVTPNAPKTPNSPEHPGRHETTLRPLTLAENGVFSSQVVQLAILKTLPPGPGHRHRLIFDFVRRLKAIPELRPLPAANLQSVVAAWHTAALDKIGTKDFVVTWQDFVFAWEECQHPWSETIVDTVFQQVITEEPPAKAVALYGVGSVRTQLAALCRGLQRTTPGEPFFLSTRQAGTLLRVSPMHAARWLNRLVSDGLLVCVTKGRLKEHQASEFRYVGD